MGRPPHLDSKKKGTYRDDHGTPEWVLDVHRAIHGPRIDLDLASNREANKLVKAASYYSRRMPCPLSPSILGGEVVWSNPPGPCKNTVKFWGIWCGCVRRGAEGSFLVFNSDHFRSLTNTSQTILYVGMLKRRVKFVGQVHGASWPSMLISTKVPRGVAREAATWMAWQTC